MTTQSFSTEQNQKLELFRQNCIKPLNNELAKIEKECPADGLPVIGDPWHQRVGKALQNCQASCREFELANRDEPEFLNAVRKIFLVETDPWLGQSWLMNRSRTKPSGFPGDYDMLLKIYAYTTPARGLGAYIDAWAMEMPLGHAVRKRMQCVRQFLLQEISERSGKIRVLDVASGPCKEFENWPAIDDNKIVEVIAMDNDNNALSYVESNVANQLDSHTTLKPVRYNALRTRNSKNTIREFGKFDLIFSVGLCDYLTDEQLVRLLSAWRETLSEGGTMYVAFKDTVEYDHTPYQWFMDWYFYQRTEAQVIALFEQAGFPVNELDMSKDGTRIITNYVYHAAPVIVRTDAAHEVNRRHQQPVTTSEKRSQELDAE